MYNNNNDNDTNNNNDDDNDEDKIDIKDIMKIIYIIIRYKKYYQQNKIAFGFYLYIYIVSIPPQLH